MTFKEGFIQAQREFGDTEEEIKARFNHAHMVLPIPAEVMNREIEPGQEREFIESILAARKKVEEAKAKNPAGFKAFVRSKLDPIRDNN